MWERGARHNPASFRYRFYMDHRPILPQDPTLGFWRKSHNQYRNIYYGFRINSKKVKYLFSNNIPVNDREDLKSLIDYDNKFRKNFKYVAFLGAIYSSGYIFNNVNFGNKYFYRLVTIAAAYTLFNLLIHKQYLNYFNDLTSYYYYKYQHLAVEDLSEVNDPRRKFFQLDKDSYYRESAHDIRHNAHHPANAGHHDHDTSTYYGPYPVHNFFYIILMRSY